MVGFRLTAEVGPTSRTATALKNPQRKPLRPVCQSLPVAGHNDLSQSGDLNRPSERSKPPTLRKGSDENDGPDGQFSL